MPAVWFVASGAAVHLQRHLRHVNLMCVWLHLGLKPDPASGIAGCSTAHVKLAARYYSQHFIFKL